MADYITYGALDVITTLLAGATWYGAWGSGSEAPSRASTTLSGEESEARQAATLTQESNGQTNDTLVASYTMTSGGSKTITNTGVLSASTVGTLILVANFSGIALSLGNTVAFTFRLRLR